MITKKYIDDLAYSVIGLAIEVHKQLGPGLLESVYEECLFAELIENGYQVQKQTALPIIYKNQSIGNAFRIDILVANQIIVELKATENMIPLYEAQLLTYMKLAQKPKGILINFNTTQITKHLKQFVNEYYAQLP